MSGGGAPAPRRRPRAAVALPGLLALVPLLTACPTSSSSVDPVSFAASPSSEAPLPVYAGPPPGVPPTAGPLTALRAAVDLTPSRPEYFSRVEAAVGTPDGGAYVLVERELAGPPAQLVTVAGPGGGYAVTRSVPLPELQNVSALHLLADGTVAVTGRLQAAGRPGGGYGFHVVDPATGQVRTTTSLPYGPGAVFASGRSAASPDGRTLYLFLSVVTEDEVRERLVAVDAPSGILRADRDLAGDLAEVSAVGAGRQATGLVARPGGGVTLVVDASPAVTEWHRIPTVFTYDARLTPVGRPVGVTTLHEGAETAAVAVGTDGAVFLVVEVLDDAWILAVPDGGGAGPVLVQLGDRVDLHALTVEPAQVWALMPAPQGARPVDLTTGEIREPLDLGCLGPEIDEMVPAAEGALLIGECDIPRTGTQMLWIVGP